VAPISIPILPLKQATWLYPPHQHSHTFPLTFLLCVPTLCPVRFEERVRVVVYLEREVRDRLVAEAESRGLTFCEVARERLCNENRADQNQVERVHEGRSVPSRGGRRAMVTPVQRDAPATPTRTGNFCKHGSAKGNNCWQCGGLAVIE
jgi:hypothetical protein